MSMVKMSVGKKMAVGLALLASLVGNVDAFASPKTIIGRATLESSMEDKAGPWGVFGPGSGRINPTPYDWHLRFSFHAFGEIEITSITFLHNQTGYPSEGWSTSSEQFYGKGLYPLVVFKQPEIQPLWCLPDPVYPRCMPPPPLQINTKYDQTIGEFSSSSYVLHLYGQIENPSFGGGKLIVKLKNGETYDFRVRARDVGHCTMEDVGMKSFEAELESEVDASLSNEAQNVELNLQLAENQMKIDSARQELNVLNTRLNDEVAGTQKLSQDLASVTQEKSVAETKLSSAQKEAMLCKDDLKTSGANQSALLTEVAKLREDASSYSSSMDSIKRELKVAKRTIARLRAK